jgi:hypothetical protein
MSKKVNRFFAAALSWNLGLGLFFFIALLSMGGRGIYLYYDRKVPQSMSLSLLRVAFKSMVPVRSYDPARIELDTEAVILDNLYSPLLRMSVTGSIEPDLAEAMSWEGNDVTFKIRDSAQTVDGYPVTAQDAEFTLKRILSLDSNAHGELKTFLCPHQTLKTPFDPCSGIRVEGNSLILTLAKAEYRPFLLQLLANVDFGVIPRRSCDLTKPGAPIVDFRNTSGPYYVEKDDDHGAYVLALRPGHWLAKPTAPRRIEFTPSTPDEALGLLERGEVDFIPTIHTEPTEKQFALRESGQFDFFDTYPLRKLLVGTTVDQLKDFSDEQRLKVMSLIRDAYLTLDQGKHWKPAFDFFPILGEGALTEIQATELKERIARAQKVPLPRKVTLGVFKKRMPEFRKALAAYPEIELVEIINTASFVSLRQRTDFFITSTDTGFHESVSLISYNIASQRFDLTKAQAGSWFERYMSEPEKAKRLEQLRELNFRSAAKGLFMVIGEAPYTAVMKKELQYSGSRYFAENPFWLISKK